LPLCHLLRFDPERIKAIARGDVAAMSTAKLK